MNWPCSLGRVTSVVLAIFGLTTVLYSQNTPSAPKAAPAPSMSQAAVPITMTECEGTNNCATWTFLGKQGNGQWPSGQIANLSVENFDADTVVIHRADSTGAAAGLTAVYNGTRHGDRIAGEFTSSWPGHFNSMSGNWSATIGKTPQSLPSMMRTCSTPSGTCWTWTWNHGHYDGVSSDSRNASMIMESFTPASVVMRVSIPPLCTTDCRYTCVNQGKISSDGNRIIKGDTWDSRGDTYHFNAVWGNALGDLHAPGNPEQSRVVVRPVVCFPWFFGIVCQ
jgi:hypothetical protein